MIQIERLAGEAQIISVSPYPTYEPILPSELADLSLPPEIDLNRPVILFGQVPTWVYGRLVSLFATAPWIGCFSAPEAEAVIIHSRVPEFHVGDVKDVPLRQRLAPAVLVGGPPDSGKSVFSEALLRSVRRHCPGCQVFLHRANWDGEGNWSHEMGNQEWVKRLVRRYERRIHERSDAGTRLAAFFEYHTQAVANLRRVVDLVIVDVGGMPQVEKRGLVKQCTHAILISRAPQLVGEWREFCEPDLTVLAVIHSVLEDRCEVVQDKDLLEMMVGEWQRNQGRWVPDEVVQKIADLLES